MKIENIYLKLPFFLQAIFINILGYRIKTRRFNKNFHIYQEKYIKSRPSNIDTHQLRLFMQESSNVLYWRKKFKKYGVQIDADDLIKEIQKLPILNKQFVRQNTDLFINKKYLDNAFWSHTSGSTGSPLKFPYTYDMENKQWAIWTRYRLWHGITKNTWMGWFGGKVIVNVNTKKPPYWHTNYPMKQVMFSSFHLNQKTVRDYFNKIKTKRLPWLHGYPSQLALLASFIKTEGLGELPDLKIITIGSESLLNSQRALMEEVFKVPIKQHYGLAEGVSNISETKDGLLVCDQDFCFTEYIPVDNSENNLRHIIGTNYNNLVFPLFRYDTGDLATIKKNESNLEYAINLDGRIEDYITLRNGTKVGRLAHFFHNINSVREAQIHQTSLDLIKIYIVKEDNFTNEDAQKIIQSASQKLGSEINISLEFVPSIKKTKSGKLRFVISDLI